MHSKTLPEVLSPSEMAYMSGLNERDRRLFLATRAESLRSQGLSYHKFSKKMGISTHTLQNGLQELHSEQPLTMGRIRRADEGRHDVLPQHPEWVQATVQIIDPHIAQILDFLGLKERSFRKDVPMREVRYRNERFEHIAATRDSLKEVGIPIISIDTKKKELLGNFKRDGKALSNGTLKAFDHDFATFGNGTVVPHGIYDVTRNVGYMTMGVSHDTSKFVCDNIERIWNEYLREQYPEARTIAILYDGGGSSSHRIVKQDLMDLANRLNMRLLVMHYPPYCSKFNPIEHRLFSQITRSWNGAQPMSVEDAAERAARTTTKTGLKVYVDINNKTYDIKRQVDESYEKRLSWQVVFSPTVPSGITSSNLSTDATYFLNII